MESRSVLTVYLRRDDEKLFEALMTKYHCDADALAGIMISVFSSIAFAPNEITLLLGIGGDK